VGTRSKDLLDPHLTPLSEFLEGNDIYAGELNYIISRILISYTRGRETYEMLNTVIGALEAAKLEFYRRQVVPYEDEKIALNGDIYLDRT